MEVLTFEFDPVADSLKVAGIDYANGTFRAIVAPLKSGGVLALESRGGGVFRVSVPEHVPVRPDAARAHASEGLLS
jgi:hypothetical protein